MAAPEPFRIHVPEEQLEDLRLRLRRARVVPDEVGAGEFDPNGAWAYGTDRNTLRDFVEHWLEKYDWRLHEARLNALAHYKLSVKGLGMHYIHERSDDPAAIPLLLVHGWPGSIVEFLEVIPKLKAAGFHVVAPSIPGFGWSEAPSGRGGHARFMADHMHELMLLLGYEKYVAQGGDWGSIINSFVARQYPQHCVAYHSNMIYPGMPPFDMYSILKVLLGLVRMPASERQGMKDTFYFIKHETAYQAIQGTKPQSLSYGLNDSPVGLLAWFLEKFQSWADCGHGGPEMSGLTKDDILTNVMVYWVTQTIASSCRIYYESLGMAPGGKMFLLSSYVAVPTGVLMANDIFKFPRVLVELSYNIKHWSDQAKGGHFFAFEQPHAFAADVVHFFKSVINFEDCKKNAPKLGQGRPLEFGRVAMYAALCALLAKVLRRRLRRSML